MVSSSEVIKDGDYILLYHSPSIKYITKVSSDGRFDTVRGSIKFSDIVGREYGIKVKSSLGIEFFVTKPSIVDLVLEEYRRTTQVIYPKDAAYIILRTGIGPGCRVLEVGTGSGFMTTFLAYYVRPNGKVYTYDRRPEFIEVAKKNIEKSGLLNYVEFKVRDVISEGIDLPDNYVDAAVLDMSNPWDALPEVYRVLKHGAVCAIYLPSILQVEKILRKIQSTGFIDPEVIEILTRTWKPVPDELRPETWMIAHTGFIVFTKKP